MCLLQNRNETSNKDGRRKTCYRSKISKFTSAWSKMFPPEASPLKERSESFRQTLLVSKIQNILIIISGWILEKMVHKTSTIERCNHKKHHVASWRSVRSRYRTYKSVKLKEDSVCFDNEVNVFSCFQSLTSHWCIKETILCDSLHVS